MTTSEEVKIVEKLRDLHAARIALYEAARLLTEALRSIEEDHKSCDDEMVRQKITASRHWAVIVSDKLYDERKDES